MVKLDKMEASVEVFDKENFDLEAFNEVNFEGTLETFTVFVPTDVMNVTRVQDDYDYDMEASHNTFFWDELLPTLIVYCLTFVLGLVGNALIIFTIFRYRKMKSTTNVFLASLASSDLLLILFCIPVKKPHKHETKQRSRSKSPKKDFLYLHLKPLLKPKTSREPPESREEVKRYRKPSDRMIKRKDSGMHKWTQDSALPNEVVQFNNTWEHTNYSVVPTVEVGLLKEHKGRDRKRKKSQKLRKRSESDHRLEATNSKNLEFLFTPHKSTKIKVIHRSSYDDFHKDRKSGAKETGGKAVVIYHRRNRRKYMNPHTGGGYHQFEQIAFERSCEATVDMDQSKRSLSEPRQNSMKELFLASQKTRMHMEPHKMASSQSDFQSAINFFKQNPTSLEFNKLEEIKSSFSTFLYQDPVNKKCEEKIHMGDSNQNRTLVKKSVSSTNARAVLGQRLQKTAEKKLDLYKEMIRTEENNRKKFWESIQRSLNYRCALAQMFSSHSYVSSNESSRFFSSTDNSTSRSTSIFVRESVISSYQGFSRFITSKKADPKSAAKPLHPPYRSLKTVLDTILIKEDEEEEEFLVQEQIDDGFTSQSSSNSIVHSPYDSNCFHYASDKLSFIESTLCNSDTNSKLEMLMARLSDEIRKCSQYMKKLNDTAKKRVLTYTSASDSKIDLRKMSVNTVDAERRNKMGWSGMEGQIVYPVFVFSASNIDSQRPDKQEDKKPNQEQINEKKGSEKTTEKENKEKSQTKPSNEEGNKKTEKSTSNSLNTLPYPPELSRCSSYTQPGVSPNKPKSKYDGFQCCDDCKLLKKRIVRLEQDLEKIEKRMPLYPPEYQELIKECLESLNVTSETFLKRLESCAKLRFLDQNRKCKKQKSSKRSSSAPEPVLHEFYSRPVFLRPSNSDCKLNVGMELTMENFDPVTGKKVYTLPQGNLKQEGNVKCRLVQDGRKPILMMDTDFCYSPDTGMLFKNKKQKRNTSSEILVPVEFAKRKPPSVSELKGYHGRPSTVCERLQVGNEFLSSHFGRKFSNKSHRDLPEEVSERPYLEDQEQENRILTSRKSQSRERRRKSACRSDESLKSYSELSRMRQNSIDGRKKQKMFLMAEKKHGKTGSVYSQIPIRRKKAPNGKPVYETSEDSTTTVTILPHSGKSNKIERIVKSCASITEGFPAMEKSTQTYQKPGNVPPEPVQKVSTANAGTQEGPTMRHYGVQVAVKRHHEEVQCEGLFSPSGDSGTANTLLGETVSESQTFRKISTTTMTVAVQADTSKRRKPSMTTVGLQINLPTEESLKYMSDLQVQKKVNLAIAELCFHLTQEKEQEGA